MIDKDVYLDVDGTLTRECMVADGKGQGPREYIEEFIEFLVTNFKNVYWLTGNPRFAKYYLESIGRKDLSDKMILLPQVRCKYDAIDYSRSFYFFDDEIEYDTWQEIDLLTDCIPAWKTEPYISKYDETKHTMYYIRADAPMDHLKYVIEDVKKRERL